MTYYVTLHGIDSVTERIVGRGGGMWAQWQGNIRSIKVEQAGKVGPRHIMGMLICCTANIDVPYSQPRFMYVPYSQVRSFMAAD